MVHKHKTQSEILALLQEAIVKEELAIPLYVSHIEQAFFWSGLSKKVQEEIVERLKILESESQGHVQTLKRVQAYYLESK